ncbi:acyl-CoA synthetase (AMP-forming)/AMP-acid ligase II [Microbacterium sp. SLBN-154]|uniref:alpha/beta fold hydrolase n=1 Tax=Microbacterium sp. SLBN-154 TaxID=2768458 RepID=UPI00114E0A35|nr:alpha/beta fold hydrolase [Microbacterium sp. SLBN-154]TQK18758.1 acyl-CoA synthetase (AMP-forming)/AMP-acid ligase II [Microbacterium sp. SLBN-154]
MTSPAALPPEGLPGLDPRFSRLIAVPGRGVDEGMTRTWHVLDTGPEFDTLGVTPRGTILAVHGNPTWSYLWRSLVARSFAAAEAGEPAWRVIAVDQLDMGFSERTDVPRPLAQRVRDLTALTDTLELTGPVVTLGHDWGGVVSLGWAIDHPELLAGVSLLNTAVDHPEGVPIPAPLRLAGARGMLAASTVQTTAFLDTTLALASPALTPEVKAAFRVPYGSAERRRAIGGFVADIPVDARHESFAELQRIADGVSRLTVPALMLWGPRDPIFSDRYLDDLVERMPQAHVHRFEGAGHLIAEDRDYATAVLSWLAEPHRSTDATAEPPAAAWTPLWERLDARRADGATAVIEMGATGATRRVSWRVLDDRVRTIAAGLAALGVRRGDRVSLLVPPGPTLTAIIYACLRIGAVVVVADAGLGLKGLTRAVRGAWPDVVIGEVPGLTAARVLGWPGIRISVPTLPPVTARALGIRHSLADVTRIGAAADLPPTPGPDDPAAILFTSGSTGPAKGVAYTHRQLSALRDVLSAHFDVRPDTGLVTGFAPFALLGPALGTLSVTPEMDVSAPRTLTATAVAAAVRASQARIVFLSPAAILNVVATADALTSEDRTALAGVETFLSTGAPIGEGLLTAAARVMPNATAHTPYGMTECLLVTDITLDGIRAATQAPDAGVCVGTPIGANRVRISALDTDGRATGSPTETAGVLGEILVSAPHLKDHYDRLWLTDREAARATPDDGARWHRTGDVGHLDADGRLWVEGRVPHVLVTADGPLAPVGPEQQVERVDGVRRAAVVGVGPRGLRQAVAVVETTPAAKRPGLAAPELAARIRVATGTPLVAVLAVPALPTDIRHNSKIDRTRLSLWAERVLSGERPTAP